MRDGDKIRVEQAGSFSWPQLMVERWTIGFIQVAPTTTRNVWLARGLTLAWKWPPVRWAAGAVVR